MNGDPTSLLKTEGNWVLHVPPQLQAVSPLRGTPLLRAKCLTLPSVDTDWFCLPCFTLVMAKDIGLYSWMCSIHSPTRRVHYRYVQLERQTRTRDYANAPRERHSRPGRVCGSGWEASSDRVAQTSTPNRAQPSGRECRHEKDENKALRVQHCLLAPNS